MDSSSTAARASNRVRKWRSQRPFDTADYFVRRLGLERLTAAEFSELLASAPEEPVQGAEPSAWVSHVEHADAIAHEIAEASHAEVDGDSSGLAPVRAFVAPFATAAMAQLYDAARSIAGADPSAPFRPFHAATLFEPLLVAHLVGRAMKVVILELNVARVQGKLAGATPQERCADFTRLVRAGPLRDQIIDEYPVLVRSLVTAADDIVRAAVEFLTHLTTDAPALRDTFGDGQPLGMLTGLSGSSGDVHRHGRSVMIAEFSSGLRVVYKPRLLAVDRHFHDLIAWVNARGQTPPLRAVQTIAAGDHGWAEYVANAPCDTPAQVARFYDRIGAYVAILHVLNATDFHYENVIAAGEFPMLIDLEALFHPHSESANPNEPEWLGWSALQASVLRTGVLPFRVYHSEQSRGLDMSALGGTGGQLTPNRFPMIVGVGTDEMRFERDYFELPASQNRPALGAQPADPVAFADRVVASFARTYRLLLAHRDALLADDGPIRRFAHDPIRVVLRPTRQYALIIAESHHPDVMRDALERDRLVDRLWAAIPNRPELERIVRWEHADLLRGDVPLFTTRPSSRDLFTTHETSLPDFFSLSGLASAIERIQAMGEADLERQVWVARAALVALAPMGHDGVWPAAAVAARPRSDALSLEPPSSSDALSAARGVADRLVMLALRREGRVSWLGLTLVRDRDWTIQPVGSELYGGTMGIALFLAYLDHISPNEQIRLLASDVVRQSTQRLDATLASLDVGVVLPSGALGAFGTLGGAVYALAHVGALWGDDALLEVADRLTSALVGSVDADRHLDIIGGLAGFIMAAAALERVRPGGSSRAGLHAAAQTLLARAERSDRGLSWTTALAASQPLTGISHGAAGMALALATAGELLGDGLLIEAARDAQRYERSTLDPVRQNWPDYRILDDRPHGETPVMLAWCHGAPGIGLARLATLGVQSDPELLTDLRLALRTTVAGGFGANDSLCHGDLGNLELLIRARELGYEGEWTADLVRQSARLVAKLRRADWQCGIPGGVETPGLMMGLAGIGYGLLRIAAPNRVPSLLSLEAPRVPAGGAAR